MNGQKLLVQISWAVLFLSIIGWPVTQFTVFKHEPPGILALSWFAIIFTCVQIVLSAYIKRGQDSD